MLKPQKKISTLIILFLISFIALFINIMTLPSLGMPPASLEGGDSTLIFLPLIIDMPCNQLPKDVVYENEPNNTFSQAAGPVLRNVIYAGCFSNSSDKNDVYYFVLSEPSTIIVSLKNIPSEHDYDLVLYDEDGDLEGLSNNDGNQEEIIQTSELPPQKYFIQVNNFLDTLTSEPYELMVDYYASLPCNHIAVTEEIFPQLKDEPDQYPIYGPINDPNFVCRAVYSPVKYASLSIYIKYTNAGDNYGYWGINVAPTGYSADSYTQLCLYARTEDVLQSFYLKIKDLDGNEVQKAINVNSSNWIEKCVDLSFYIGQGIDIKRIENINIGFDKSSGDAEVWVDYFMFK